jgi:hypothetical protein
MGSRDRELHDQRGTDAFPRSEFPPMGEQVNVPMGKEMQQECIVPHCPQYGTVDETQFIQVEWPSGRQVRGRIKLEGKVCEHHFEKLVEGHDV